MKDDTKQACVGLGILLFCIILCSFLFSLIEKNRNIHCYKLGQIDAINNIDSYELVKKSNNSITWETNMKKRPYDTYYYKMGFVDVKKGIIKYQLIETEDGSKIWEEIDNSR
jgi:hypothetical protein